MPAQLAFPLGFRQAAARHLLPEGALLEALDVTNDENGALITRAGSRLVYGLPQSDVHSIFISYARDGTLLSYVGAGTSLFRNGVEILSHLSGNFIDFANMRGLGEQTLYTFFALGGAAYKDDGTTLTQWGLNPPSVAPTIGLTAAQSVLIDQVDSVTGWSGANLLVVSTDAVDHQTSTGSLKGILLANQTGFTTKTIGPVNLSVFPNGVAATDTDAILLWFEVDLLANLDRIDIALNFSGTTQFITGYYTATVFASTLNQSDHTWTHIAVSRSDFAAVGTDTPSWAAINGIRLQVTTNGNGPVTVHFNQLQLFGGVGIGQQAAVGPTTNHTYRWRLTHRRKPIPTGVVYGTWTDGSATFTDATGAPLPLSDAGAGDGHVVGASDLFGEIAYGLQTAAVGASVYEWSYSNGTGWTVFTPDDKPLFSATGGVNNRLRFSFPTTNWRQMALVGDPQHRLRFWIRMRATTAPATAAVASAVKPYDTVIAAESNPSPPSVELATLLQGVTLSALPNASVPGADFDPQITHLGIYRTVADQSLEESPFLFEDDVPVGYPTFFSHITDDELLQILIYDNDRPPAFTSIAEHQQRIFGLVGNQVYVSKFEMPESFPANLPFDVGTLSDPPLRIWADEGLLFVGTASRFYQIVGFGQDATSNPFVPQEMNLPTGLGAAFSLVRGALGRYFFATDGTLWRLAGAGQGQNISDDALYQLFHQVPFNGVQPVSGTTSRCVSGWLNNRFYFSYPFGGATTPSATLVLDERTQTWYRDSRAFRSFHYDRRGDILYAGDTQGGLFAVGEPFQTTDHGTVISPIVQTRDEDEGAPDSDKLLMQLGVDVYTAANIMSVGVVRDFAGPTDALLLGTVQNVARAQTYLSPPTSAPIENLSLGYRLTWSGEGHLYRLLPRLLRFPPRRSGYDTLPLDLGWPGAKRLEAFFLDVDNRSGVLTIDLFADERLVETFTVSTLGRQYIDLLHQVHDGTLWRVSMRSTGVFLLYPQTMLVWLPEPPTVFVYETLPSDLGAPGFKTLVDVYRDFEWVSDGVITMDFVDVDTNTVIHSLSAEGVVPAGTRTRLPRERLPRTPFRLLQVNLFSTGGMKIWDGTRYSYNVLGGRGGTQIVPLAQQALSGVQRTPLVEAA